MRTVPWNSSRVACYEGLGMFLLYPCGCQGRGVGEHCQALLRGLALWTTVGLTWRYSHLERLSMPHDNIDVVSTSPLSLYRHLSRSPGEFTSRLSKRTEPQRHCGISRDDNLEGVACACEPPIRSIFSNGGHLISFLSLSFVCLSSHWPRSVGGPLPSTKFG